MQQGMLTLICEVQSASVSKACFAAVTWAALDPQGAPFRLRETRLAAVARHGSAELAGRVGRPRDGVGLPVVLLPGLRARHNYVRPEALHGHCLLLPQQLIQLCQGCLRDRATTPHTAARGAVQKGLETTQLSPAHPLPQSAPPWAHHFSAPLLLTEN